MKMLISVSKRGRFPVKSTGVAKQTFIEME